LTQGQEDATVRAARLIAEALSELSAAGRQNTVLLDELARNRFAVESLRQQMDQRLAEERQQRAVLSEQITSLAGSLDRLVTHLEGISLLMSDLAGLLPAGSAPRPASPVPNTSEPPFRPGGEGISLGIGEVPGFQALMDIQKALMAMEQVAGASVERFQERESRIQLHLRVPVTGLQLASALGGATGYAFAVEESRPEVMSLRLKIVG
jgi:chromosome segregation ATPase